MKNGLLMMLLSQLLALLSPEMIKKTLNSALEFIEEKVNETATELDNATILPVIKLIRTTLGIIDSAPGNYQAVKSTTAMMLNQLLSGLFMYLSPDLVKGFIDKGLDVIENTVEASETKLDDTLMLPIINMIRTTFDIPDNDFLSETAEFIDVIKKE